MSNRKLNRAISDIGMYEFKRQLNYKAKLKGNIILENDKWFASSKTCPNCGNIKKDLTLKDRVYKCEVCGLKGDRDYIASINQHNQLPRIHREVTPVEIAALNLLDVLIDLTNIKEAGIKHHL
jgi:putative transposase